MKTFEEWTAFTGWDQADFKEGPVTANLFLKKIYEASFPENYGLEVSEEQKEEEPEQTEKVQAKATLYRSKALPKSTKINWEAIADEMDN